MHRAIVAVVGGLVALAGAETGALAKRLPPPKTEICNATKHKQYVATMSYAGRGRTATRGWTFIAPGRCQTFSADRFHVRGKAAVTGWDAKNTREGCVAAHKVFNIVAGRAEAANRAHCTERNGKLVRFRSPRAAGGGTGYSRTSKPIRIGGS